MNRKAETFIRNFSYTLISNILSLFISTLVVLIIPKLIGVIEYGYWQLYLFYSSYVGFLHLGWISGLYLKLGGKSYHELNKKSVASQFYLLLFFQVFIALSIIIFVSIFNKDSNRDFILYMVSLCVILTNMRDFISFIFQATSRIKEYAKVITIGRVLYFVIIILFLLTGVRDFRLMIVADLLGRLVSLLYAIYTAKDIVFNKPKSLTINLKDAANNISIGSKLMLANVASMLIIGVVRFGIERAWDVETFGKVSLTLSASNLMMIFINAVSIIIFPILRRTNEAKLADIYSVMRDFLMVILLSLLIGYYPIKTILSTWLPKYSESLMYMALLFPMFIYEGKMALLINSYLKTLRKEKLMLKINTISVIISLVFTIMTTVLLKNLDIAILSIVILLAIRSVLAETILSKLLKISMKKDILLELILTFIFIMSGWFINSWMTTIIYGTAFLIYLFIKRKEIIYTVNSIKILIKA